MLPQSRVDVLVVPQTVTTGGTLSGYFDTKGYDFATINILSGTVAANKPPYTILLAESDTTPTAFSDCTNIVTFCGSAATSTSYGYVIPTPRTTTSTGVNTYAVQYNVDLRGRKRYLAVEFTPSTTHTLIVTANLHRAEQTPDSTTKAGVLKVING